MKNSGGDTEILQIGDEQGDDVTEEVNLKDKTVEINEDQAGSDPGETHESRPPPEQVLMDEDQARPDSREGGVALAGPDPEPTHNEFMADLYPKVQESLKFPTDEHVILEEPLSSFGTLSSMKNLDDAYTIGDQFINDKATEDEPEKLNLRDLPHKIDEAVRENVKEAVQVALQAPLRDRFRDLPEADMKEMLHQRMFETGSYQSLPEHIALCEALKASMERAQRDEFFAERDKSHKRRRDDQDPPHPPTDSDLSKKKRHDSGASGSLQPPAPQSSAWKTTDTREAPSSSSKQQFGPHSEQPVEDIPMSDTANISDSEDTEEDRPATPEPAWVIPTSHIPDAVNNWANALATTYQAPAENSLLEKTRDMRTFMNYKGRGPALSISKMKAARYHDFGLELLVPEHMRINDICTYDISASYGFEYKHGYTITDSPRAVVFPVSNNEWKIMRFNEIYKFSDGTLTNILEALDYRVKEYKVNQLNLGMNTRF
ncbi:hypothetical protein Tco_0005886 [Tanacetum coccineum]